MTVKVTVLFCLALVLAAAAAAAERASGPVVTVATTMQETPRTPVCVVPRLVGLTLAAARTAADRHHCMLTVTYRMRPATRSGRVIRQRAPVGVRLVHGAAIGIVVTAVTKRAGSRG